MLGCGCCLMLICVILCIHAYLVMSDVARNRQLGLNEQTVSRNVISLSIFKPIYYIEQGCQNISLYITVSVQN